MMAGTKFFKLYNADGSTNAAFARNRAGVYLIKENGVLKYIGYSSGNLYKTMLRHFQAWTTSNQVRASFADKSVITVRVILTTPERAPILEAALLKRLNPPDNPRYLKGEPTKTEAKYLSEYDGLDWNTPSTMPTTEEAPF